MPTSLIEKIKKEVKNLDFFSLGNSAVIYYFLMFFVLPLSVFLHLPSKFIEYFIGQGMPVLTFWTVFCLVIGIFSFIIGYWLFNFIGKNRKIPNVFKKEWNLKKVGNVFTFVFIAGLVVKTIRIFGGGYFYLNINPSLTNSPFYSLIGLLYWLGPIALAIAFGCYFYLFKIGSSRYRTWKFISWAVFLFEFVYGFFSGSRANAIIPILIYLITKHYLFNRSYRRAITTTFFILLILMPLQNFYKNPQISFKSYSKIFDHQIKLELKGIQQFVFDSSIGRIDQSRILSAVFEKTEKFLHGETFLELLTSFGPPRFIWKNKPLSVNSLGNQYGREIGILGPNDFQTSINPTMPGDWYMNFGIGGIIFGMFLIGMIFRLIYNYLILETNNSLSGVMIYSIFWIQIIKGMENYIAPVYAGLVKTFVILILIHIFLARKAKS